MIRFLDLQKVNALYAADMKAAASEIIDNGWFCMANIMRNLPMI